jgi:stage V sporulation protein R
MSKDKLLFKGYDWDVSLVESLWEVIDKIGKEDLGLDYHQPQFDIVTAEQMLDAYSSIGMPIFYNHWSFGKSYAQNSALYRKGKMGLAYEMVINSNPCLAYLMEDNTAMMTALVIAHANVGHASVFKMNYLFQQHTKPDEILNLLEQTKKFVRECEDTYGEDQVEALLDVLHYIGPHGVDKFPRADAPTAKEQHDRYLAKLEAERVLYNKEFDTLPKYRKHELADLAQMLSDALEQLGDIPSVAHMCEENLLRVVEEHSLVLEKWQLKIVNMYRQIQQYFYPQMQTQVINEGFACFCHYYIMTKLHDEGYIDEGAYLEFLESHTAVCAQYEGTRINPYALGFAMFMDVKRACESPDEEDYKYLKSVAGKDWRTVVKDIVRYYKDESFIYQFLGPKVIRRFKLFAIKNDTEEDYYEVTGIQSDDDIKQIRSVLAKQKEIDNFKPSLEVVQIDRVENEITIEYTPYAGRDLEDMEGIRDRMIMLTGMDVRIIHCEDYQ